MTAELEERVSELEERMSELEEMVEGGTVMAAESDMDAFLERVKPGTHTERATAIGFYLYHEDGMDAFTVGDVEDGYEECRIPKPANLSDVLAGAEDRGWVMRAGTRGQKQLWRVTGDGDEAVTGGFD